MKKCLPRLRQWVRKFVAVVAAGTLVMAQSALAQAPPQQVAAGDLESLERLIAAFEYLETQIDRSTFDVAAKPQDLGHDPDRIFAFVRDEVRYEPYFGVLRGATGTLIGLAGNADDQSVLLAALLGETGVETRIATGTLDTQSADTLLALFQAGPAGPLEAPPSLVADSARFAELLGPDWPGIQTSQMQFEQRASDVIETLWEDVEETAAFLGGLLTDNGIVLGQTGPGELERAMAAEARAHTWVQTRNADGAWIDLDPSFAGAAPGDTFTSVASTMAALPHSAQHLLGVAVTLRTVAGGEFQDQSLLEIRLEQARSLVSGPHW